MTILDRIFTAMLVLLILLGIFFALALDNSERERARSDIYIEQLEEEKTQLLRLVDILTPMDSPVLALMKPKPKPKCVSRMDSEMCITQG